MDPHGALFVNRKKTKKKAPVLLGEIELNQRQIEYLCERLNEGEKAKLNLAAWKNISRESRQEYLTLKLSLPYDAQVDEPAYDDGNPLDFTDS